MSSSKFAFKSRAFSLLELLLVLAVAASLVLLSINRYHQYKQNLVLKSIEQDIALIFEALSQYYHTQVCTTVNGVPGVFPIVNQNLMSNLVSGHFLSALDLTAPPPILDYQAMVVDSLQRTPEHKPLYLWRVIATLDNDADLVVYQKLLGAGSINTSNHSLNWDLSASSNMLSPNTPLWILNAHLNYFKKQQAAQDEGCV